MIMLKDSVFEPSSPLRHSTELAAIIEQRAPEKPVLFVYSDGGPDHRITYLSVKLSLFVKLDLDYLCAARTAPYHSYRNPVERIMSIVNIGLQAVALAREKMPEDMEAEAAKCNSMKALRAVAGRNKEFCGVALDSLSPVKVLLSKLMMRLELKQQKFSLFIAATDEEMDDFWTTLVALDSEFDRGRQDKITAKDLGRVLSEFNAHSCRQSHYFIF